MIALSRQAMGLNIAGFHCGDATFNGMTGRLWLPSADCEDRCYAKPKFPTEISRGLRFEMQIKEQGAERARRTQVRRSERSDAVTQRCAQSGGSRQACQFDATAAAAQDDHCPRLSRRALGLPCTAGLTAGFVDAASAPTLDHAMGPGRIVYYRCARLGKPRSSA